MSSLRATACRHSLAHAVVTVRQTRPRPNSNFAQDGFLYTWSQLCMYIKGSTVYINTPTPWNKIGPNMTAPPLALSPSRILLPPSTHCAFTPERKNLAQVLKMSLFSFFTFFKSCLSLKLRKLKLGKTGSACTQPCGWEDFVRERGNEVD